MRRGDRRRGAFRPGAAPVGGVTFPEHVRRADEHPQPAVAQFHNHVFQCRSRRPDGAMESPSLAFIGGDAHPLDLFRIESPPSHYGLQRVSDRHDPLPGREHDRLVHPEAEGTVETDAELCTPHRRRGIRRITYACMDSVPNAVLDAAVEEIPQPSLRIDPQARVVAARAIVQRQRHRLRRTEGPAVIIAVAENDRVHRGGLFRPAREPGHKHTAAGRAFQPGNALPGAVGQIDGDRAGGVQRGGEGGDERNGGLHEIGLHGLGFLPRRTLLGFLGKELKALAQPAFLCEEGM